MQADTHTHASPTSKHVSLLISMSRDLILSRVLMVMGMRSLRSDLESMYRQPV